MSVFSFDNNGKFRDINSTRVVYLHYTDWCSACQMMKPVWEDVKIATQGSGIVFKEINEEKTPTPGINRFPTIIMLDERGSRMRYFGGNDFEKLRSWVVSPTPPDF